MSVRRLSLLLTAAALYAMPVVVLADPPAVVAPAANTVGTITADADVRSGASPVDPKDDPFYSTCRLPKGSSVTLIGEQDNDAWYKIAPPAGSFCLISKAMVSRQDGADAGTVNVDRTRVRVGSALVATKTTSRVMLNAGSVVRILGDDGQYFKITPPAGSYLCVSRAVVDLTPQAVPVAPPVAPAAKIEPVATVTPPPPIADPIVSTAPVAATQPADVAMLPTTRPADVASNQTPPPVGPAAPVKFDAVEAVFAQTTGQKLDEQPLDSLIPQYTALSTDSGLPAAQQRIVAARLATLNLRADAKAQLAAAVKMQSDAESRRQALKAERDELAQKIKDESVATYAVVGTLRASSIAQAGTNLYRVCDPSTGHTLVYVRTSDAKCAGLLNQFVGLKGETTHNDGMNLNVLTPTACEAVDPSKVGTAVTATLVPPSMTSKAAAVSTVQN